MVFKLALRNIFRQKFRTGMTLVAIIAGVASLILSGGFVQDIFVQLGEATIRSQTGHVQVFREGFIERGTRQPDRFLVADPVALAGRIGAIEGVDRVAARISFDGMLNNGHRDLGVVGEGIEPGRELEHGMFVQINSGRQLEDDDGYGMIIGQGVAHSLDLAVGDTATLVMNTTDGALNTLDFEILGTFSSFSKEYDARAVRIPLSAAQLLMDTRGANLLVVGLERTEDTARVDAEIQGVLDPGLGSRKWTDLSDFYTKTVALLGKQFGILQAIIALMVVLSVANAINMTAFERMGEFGTLRSFGNSSAQVFRLILLESLVLGLVGAILGVVVGIVLALVISAIGIPMPPPPNADLGYTAYIQLHPGTIALAFATGLAATVLAAVLPALRASRGSIVDALRQNV